MTFTKMRYVFLFIKDMNSAARVTPTASAQCCGRVWEGKFSELIGLQAVRIRVDTVVQLSVNVISICIKGDRRVYLPISYLPLHLCIL